MSTRKGTKVARGRPNGRTRRGARVTPAQFGDDAVAWATWLYYGEGLTQERVASALGVSRASVANYLAEARHRRLVQVSLAPALLSLGELSQALSRTYDLSSAHVMPAIERPARRALSSQQCEGEALPESEANLRRRLGEAGARVLQTRLEDTTVLGVAWGRTVLALAQSLDEQHLPRARVVQVSGSSLGDEEHSPECCTALIATRLGARCENFHAPAVVSSADMRRRLLEEPGIARHVERIGGCDIALFGVGELYDGVLFDDPHFLTPDIVDHYRNKDAVAIMMGRFIDRDGGDVHGPLSGRRIGLDLHRFGAIPVRLLVAGGPSKLDAIKAALRGGYATHLVTDADTAKALVSEPEKKKQSILGDSRHEPAQRSRHRA